MADITRIYGKTFQKCAWIWLKTEKKIIENRRLSKDSHDSLSSFFMNSRSCFWWIPKEIYIISNYIKNDMQNFFFQHHNETYSWNLTHSGNTKLPINRLELENNFPIFLIYILFKNKYFFLRTQADTGDKLEMSIVSWYLMKWNLGLLK